MLPKAFKLWGLVSEWKHQVELPWVFPMLPPQGPETIPDLSISQSLDNNRCFETNWGQHSVAFGYSSELGALQSRNTKNLVTFLAFVTYYLCSIKDLG